MKKIYICSPLRGNYTRNIPRARWYCREVAKWGHIPIAPHVYCTQFLDDADPEEREMGMEIGLNLLDICDEVWVFGYQLSNGMKAEIERAANKGIPVYFKCMKILTELGAVVKVEILDRENCPHWESEVEHDA